MAVAVVGLIVALAFTPLGIEAQQTRRIARIGFLSPSSPSDPRTRTFVEAFREGLRDLGWVEGENVTIEYRWAQERTERLLDLARELVRLNVDVVVAATSPAVQAAKRATVTIPIVMTNAGDAVATGFVARIARPEANITGLSMMGGELIGKQMQILTEVVPNLSRVALLWNPTNSSNAPQLRQAEDAVRALGLRLYPLEVRGPDEIEGAFAAMTKDQPGAMIVLLDSMLVANRARIVELAAKRHLPAIYGLTDFVKAGGLIAYGPNVSDMYRRAAAYVDKILKGSKVADLPVEQPTTFELIVNLGAAKALGLAIPPSISARADQLVQ
ncbi:MAG TPA: ABC transporter substrate-binding protein [Methylomirabilota bacterium]